MAAAILTPPQSPPPTSSPAAHLHPVACRTTTTATNTSVAAQCLIAQQAIRLRSGNTETAHDDDDDDAESGSGSDEGLSSSGSSEGDDVEHEHDGASQLSHANTSSFACSGVVAAQPTPLSASPTSLPLSLSPSPPPLAEHLGVHVDPKQFPILPSTEDTSTPVRVISARQYADLVNAAKATDNMEGTERALFPFLHGADVHGSQQAAYFGFTGRNRCPVPSFRGLITVTADPERRCPVHLHQRRPTGLSSQDSYASTHSSTSISSSMSSSSLPLSASASSASIFTDFSSNSSGSSHSSSSGSSIASSISSACSCLGAMSASSAAAKGQPTPEEERRAPMTTVKRGRGPESRTHLLKSTLLPEDILSPASLLPATPHGTARFLEPALPAQVNLRNFRIQPAKYASMSDIVVYSSGGLTQGAVELARRCKEAQEAMRRKRRASVCGLSAAAAREARKLEVEYNVYVVEDAWETWENEWQELVAVDQYGWRWNRTDFFEGEREEMRVLTEASKIAHNVWLGNTQDVPTPDRMRSGSSDSCSDSMCDSPSSACDTSSTSSSGNDDFEANPRSFAITVETHDQAVMPLRNALDSQSKFLDAVENECRSWCHQVDQMLKRSGAAPTPVTLTKTAYTACSRLAEGTLHPHVNDVVHMECISTAQACDGGAHSAGAKVFIDDLVALVHFLHQQANPAPGGRLARRVLLQCADGYTDSSVLALAYVMWDRECSLPEAYLWLQDGCASIDERGRGRSFFVYSDDVPFLMRVDERFKAIREAKRKAAKKTPSSRHGSTGPQGSTAKSCPAGLGLSLLRRSTSQSSHSSSANATPTASTPNVSPFLNAGAPTSPPPSPLPLLPKSAFTPSSTTSSAAWFHDRHFDGHFPSRILPFLYLGNLNHAMNADMLSALGITHVISVGETALVPPRPAVGRCAQVLGRGRSGASSSGPVVGASGTPVPSSAETRDAKEGNALYRAQRDGRIKVLDLKGVLDDGIDPIRPFLEESIAFVDEAREMGGKCLVHCRVGVSRSATMVIGYLMSRCGWSLEKAYLLTRSRRLNILIQPNLRLFYELHLFELDLYFQRRQARLSRSLSRPSVSVTRPGITRSSSLAPSDMSLDEDTDTDVDVETDCDMAVDAVEGLSLGSGSGSGSESPERTPRPLQLDTVIHGSCAGRREEGAMVPLEEQPVTVPLDWPYLAREIGTLNMRYLC